MGHGNGFTKSEFYYAFDNIQSGIFTTRDRAAHSRKRKYVAHMFSPKAMVDFEPYITSALGTLARQMDSLIDTGSAGQYSALASKSPDIKQLQRHGEAALDMAVWNAFLAFDIIGDLVSCVDAPATIPRHADMQKAFGRPFGFTAGGCDSQDGIAKLKARGEWCVTVGQMPWIKSMAPATIFSAG